MWGQLRVPAVKQLYLDFQLKSRSPIMKIVLEVRSF